MPVSAETVADVQEAVRCAQRILPFGGRTKPALATPAATDPHSEIEALDMSQLSGIIDYDPAELTFTAAANTPVKDVAAILSEHGQYLPFDPPRASGGATLAGAVAAGTTGANGFRYGGVRDFIIGVQLVDGTGRLVSGGGRVVKNAAGFDLPKLMVGSMGRLGVMVQLSFKVFPRPQANLTMRIPFPDPERALAGMSTLTRSPLALDALDLAIGPEPANRCELLVRLGGAAETLPRRANRIAALVDRPHQRLEAEDDAQLWAQAAAFSWAPAGSQMVRVGLTAASAHLVIDTLGAIGVPVRLSLGANLAWVAWPGERPIGELDRRLTKLGLRGMRLDGPAGPLLLGEDRGGAFGDRIRSALDPERRFLEIR